MIISTDLSKRNIILAEANRVYKSHVWVSYDARHTQRSRLFNSEVHSIVTATSLLPASDTSLRDLQDTFAIYTV